MPFCTNCGAPVEGQFCPQCGTPVSYGSVPPGGTHPPPAPVASSGLSDNAASALCYLLGFVTGIIFLVIAPYNQNRAVRFHAFQSIFFSVALFVIAVGLAILATIFFAMSFWLGTLFGLLQTLFGLGVFVLWLYLMWKAYQGQKVVLPVIGPLAEKQA
ncbi:MAG: hypothetical protein ACP5U2_07615 [Bryobacteraceae bacterium]